MWGISWVPWRILSTVEDIMMHVGDIMSTVGEECFVIWIPHGTEYSTVLMISQTCIMISPTVLKLKRMVSPHSTDHPHSTHNVLHVHHDIPHGTRRKSLFSPDGTQDTPSIYHDTSTGLHLPLPPLYCTHLIQGEKVYWEGKRLFSKSLGAQFAWKKCKKIPACKNLSFIVCFKKLY